MRLSESGSFLRRGEDLPLLVLSQDYELFFGDSGSVEKCLFEPSDLLAAWSREHDVPITWYVDAGMLCAMARESESDPKLVGTLSRVKSHIESLALSGHEIGLHIHPHWEETRWSDGNWDFSGTRYKLGDFSDAEIGDIVSRYAAVLNDLCDGAVTSYRAGGFCVEPFSKLSRHLKSAGISVDSSVVPGLHIDDPDKGIRFPGEFSREWWRFSDSPGVPDAAGDFLEIPITSQRLPVTHYWRRAIARAAGRKSDQMYGDGSSKRIGRNEILRRLAGAGRVSELSVDAPKAGRLSSGHVLSQRRAIWHVMGHPKLLGRNSLAELQKFIECKDISSFATVSELAAVIRAQHQ